MRHEFLAAISPCYWVLTGLASLFYGVRGVVGHRIAADHANSKFEKEGLRKVETWENVVIRYIQDFIFNVVCSVAGFLSLYLSYFLAGKIADAAQVSAGLAILLGLSFIIGIAGVSGQLPYLLLEGRVPKVS